MTREEAIDMVKYILKTIPKEPPIECDYVEEWFDEDDKIRKALNMAIKALEQEPKWIPIKTRKLTDAEEQDMLENSNYYYTYMFDCRLPENGEEVLVTTYTGEVTTTTFYDEGIDGCSFEFYEGEDDVIAWMPKPKSYKAESEG